MPTYNFQDKETGEILEKVMKISEKDTFLKDNPHLKSVILDVNIVAFKSKQYKMTRKKCLELLVSIS